MVKILQVVHGFVPHTFAGTEVYSYKLSKELSQRHQVHVFFRLNNPDEKEYSLRTNNFEGIQTHALNHTFNQCSSFEGLYSDGIIDQIFGELLDRIKPDIIHIQHLLFLSLGVVREAKKRKIPVVFTINDYWLFCPKGQLLKNNLSVCEDDNNVDCKGCLNSQLHIRKNVLFCYNKLKSRVPNAILQLAKNIYLTGSRMLLEDSLKCDELIQKRKNLVQDTISQVDLFIAPSNFIKERFISFGVPIHKIYMSRYGVDSISLESVQKMESKKIRFGYIGTLLPMKGVDILVVAFKNIKNNNIRLSIYGKPMAYAGYESYHRQLERMARDDNRVRLMGGFNNNNIGKIMTDIDVLIVPSIWPENSPLVIQEAFLAKTPVIASRIGGIPELINEEVNGLLFNPGSAKDLQEKLEYIINHAEIINRFKDHIPQVKSMEENAREIEAVYSGLLTTNKACDTKY